MESRVAVIGIIVEDPAQAEPLNHILHEYGSHIIGRMGIPYPKRGSTSSVWRWTRPRTSSRPWRARWAVSPG